jgi:hypothetical protein
VLAFTSAYFFESGLFKELRPIQIKNMALPIGFREIFLKCIPRLVSHCELLRLAFIDQQERLTQILFFVKALVRRIFAATETLCRR